MNQHCGKHDKIFNEENPCPGCETEKAGQVVSSAAAAQVEAPELSVTEKVQQLVANFEAALRKALSK